MYIKIKEELVIKEFVQNYLSQIWIRKVSDKITMHKTEDNSQIEETENFKKVEEQSVRLEGSELESNFDEDISNS